MSKKDIFITSVIIILFTSVLSTVFIYFWKTFVKLNDKQIILISVTHLVYFVLMAIFSASMSEYIKKKRSNQ